MMSKLDEDISRIFLQLGPLCELFQLKSPDWDWQIEIGRSVLKDRDWKTEIERSTKYSSNRGQSLIVTITLHFFGGPIPCTVS
jgi:hypothetical protein